MFGSIPDTCDMNHGITLESPILHISFHTSRDFPNTIHTFRYFLYTSSTSHFSGILPVLHVKLSHISSSFEDHSISWPHPHGEGVFLCISGILL